MNPMASRFCSLYTGTPSEHALEPHVAALGLVYRTNFPLYLWGLDSAFPDFIIPALGVIIEVDGPDHDLPKKKASDAERTARLEALGYIVIRCGNWEAVNAPATVIRRLFNSLENKWSVITDSWADYLAGRVPEWPPSRRSAKPATPPKAPTPAPSPSPRKPRRARASAKRPGTSPAPHAD